MTILRMLQSHLFLAGAHYTIYFLSKKELIAIRLSICKLVDLIYISKIIWIIAQLENYLVIF